MNVVIVGLGRIGKNVCLHLLEQNVSVIAYNRSRDDVDEVVKKGAVGAYSLSELEQKLTEKPAIVILYVPAGVVVDEMIFGTSVIPTAVEGSHSLNSHLKDSSTSFGMTSLMSVLPKGSIIIDGGNSFFQDSQRRYQLLKEKGFHFLDMGTSGGIEGARGGACLMVGGDKAIYQQVEPLLARIATVDGYGYVGPSGAGHFVKMVHNAIEYGMMGAIGEGFGLISNFKFQISNEKEKFFKFNLAKIAKIWAHGSIVSGLLMSKMQSALEKDPHLASLSGEVPKGETEQEMEWLETLNQSMPVISAARKERVTTRTKPSFVGKVIAALRREFGGHAVK